MCLRRCPFLLGMYARLGWCLLRRRRGRRLCPREFMLVGGDLTGVQTGDEEQVPRHGRSAQPVTVLRLRKPSGGGSRLTRMNRNSSRQLTAALAAFALACSLAACASATSGAEGSGLCSHWLPADRLAVLSEVGRVVARVRRGCAGAASRPGHPGRAVSLRGGGY